MKRLLILTITVMLFFAIIVVFLFTRNEFQQSKLCNNCIVNKSVPITIIVGQRIDLTVPIGWNIYENADPVLLNTQNIELPTTLAYFSASSQNYPILLTDLNWQQLDFYITDGDYIGSKYNFAIKNSETETMQSFQNDYFEGYSSTSILQPGETPSKANTGGTTYYLRPKISDPKWNVIINKQALGDSEFESQVNQIMESLKFTSTSN